MNAITPAAPPSARKLAREHGVDLEKLASELGRERLNESDIRMKIDGGAPAKTSGKNYWDVDHAVYGPVEEEPLSRFAKVAADNLSAAQHHIPAVTHHDRADMTAVEAFRKSLSGEAKERGVRMTALAFQVKALVRTLKRFPRFNASLSADGESLILKRYVDIGIAVDTPHGLMVPVIRSADRKSLWRIAADIADLATRAGERKIKPEEMGGASMSISNLGGIGGRHFSPIVNPPEVAILGITRATMEPVWDGEAFQPALMRPLDLSYDHRVINGADAARFLTHYAGLLSDPRRMLI
jgi:pyruvate dehydrogenase E2 component (dihydrolipoamide acetyltransferase)